MKTRRSFILRLTSAIPGAYWLSSNNGYSETLAGPKTENPADYYNVITGAEKLPVPEGKRVPFGWEYFTIPASSSGTTIQIPDLPTRHEGDIFLRLMVAIDTRDERKVSVLLAKSGKKIGELAIWYASALQLFDCKLSTTPDKLSAEGIRLVLDEGNEPLYIVSSSQFSGAHIFADRKSGQAKPSERFMNSFLSHRSLHPFGWMEGCTLEGLHELHRSGRFPKAGKVLDDHLKLFVPDGRNLIYENPGTQPYDNRFTNPEAGLPFVAIVERYPDHPAIDTFLTFCRSRIENGKVKGKEITTEGCYTLAYPLAAIGKATGNKECYELALLELDQRITSLTDEKAVYQKSAIDQSYQSFRNWGRGYTWFMLGLVRTAAIIKENPDFTADSRLTRVRETFIYYANLALSHQQPDHSWRAFIDLPDTGFDASATAGLGASLLYGKRIGWLPDLPDDALYAIRDRLEQSLTPDGFLTGCCQINRGGETLQKSGYRVISQYVMGLMAHLYAHLE